MWAGTPIEIDDWGDFEGMLRAELANLNFSGSVLVRNFALETITLDKITMEQLGSVDRLDLVLRTGTDRDEASDFWNATGFDHDHDLDPVGKAPQEIIYAYPVDLQHTPYKVHVGGEWTNLDLTEHLEDVDGILIYDASKLTRASNNEHWFNGDPCDALLAIFKPLPWK